MIRRAPLAAALAGAMVLVLLGSRPTSGQDFYKGKTITFIVGTAAGGGFDTYTRLIARHIGKHLPGNPNAIVQNMPGGATLIAANYLYNNAKPDGLTVGLFSGSMIVKHVLGDEAVKFDGRKFGWLGTPAPERHVCALTERSGIKSVEDWLAAKQPPRLGSLGPGNATSAVPLLLKALLGLPTRVIEGYKGTSEIRVAAEAGELEGACWGWDSIKVTWAKAVQSGSVRPVIQAALEPIAELAQVPVAINLARSEADRELLRFGARAYGPSAIAYSVPPGVPKERLAILQRGLMNTLKDPELLAEAAKSRLIINPIDGPTIARIVADLYATEPELVSRFKEITEGVQRR